MSEERRKRARFTGRRDRPVLLPRQQDPVLRLADATPLQLSSRQEGDHMRGLVLETVLSDLRGKLELIDAEAWKYEGRGVI